MAINWNRIYKDNFFDVPATGEDTILSNLQKAPESRIDFDALEKGLDRFSDEPKPVDPFFQRQAERQQMQQPSQQPTLSLSPVLPGGQQFTPTLSQEGLFAPRMPTTRQQAQTPQPQIPEPQEQPRVRIHLRSISPERKTDVESRIQKRLEANQQAKLAIEAREQELERSRNLKGEELQAVLPQIVQLRPETLQAVNSIQTDDPYGQALFDQVVEIENMVLNNQAKELENKYGYDIRDLYDNENYNRAIQLASRESFTNIKRYNTIGKTKAITPVGRFLDRVGEKGTELLLGETIPQEFRTETGLGATDVAADIVGGLTAFAAPLPGTQISPLGTGIRAGDIVGERAARLGGRAGEIAATELGQRLIRGAATGAVIDVQQGIREGDSPEQLAKRMGTGAVIGAAFDLGLFGIEKGIRTLRPIQVLTEDAVDEAIEATTLRPEVKRQVKELAGNYTYKNTELIKAQNEFNEAITTVQNYFKTNELRVDEFNRIKPELGIDFDELYGNILKAEGIRVSDIVKGVGENQRLAARYGYSEFPDLELMGTPATRLPTQELDPTAIRGEPPIGDTRLPGERTIVAPEDVGIPQPEGAPTLRADVEQAPTFRADLDQPTAPRAEVEAEPRIPTDESINTEINRVEPEDFTTTNDTNLHGDRTVSSMEEHFNEATRAAQIRTNASQKIRQHQETIRESPRTSLDLQKMIDENPSLYSPIGDEALTQSARELISRYPEQSRNLILEGEYFKSDVEPFVAQNLYTSLQEAGRYDDALQVAEAMSRKFEKVGRQLRSAQMMKAMANSTPEGMGHNIRDMINKANKDLSRNRQIDFTADDLEYITNRMREIQDISDPSEQAFQTAILFKEYRDKIPTTIGQKISTFQMMAHLGNIRTFGRNIFGNTGMLGMEGISRAIAAPIDSVTSIITGRRAVGLPTGRELRQSVRTGVETGQDVLRQIRAGIDLEGGGKYDLPPQVFKDPVLGTAEKAVRASLQVPDEFFKGMYRDQTISELVRLNNLEAPTQEILGIAEDQARYATFQDNSLPARVLTDFKKSFNQVGIKDFGLGDLMVKYTRVPGNIISRGIEYTPAGLIKAIKASKNLNNSLAAQREFSLSIGRALTGTGLLSLGAIMQQKGIIDIPHRQKDLNAMMLDRGEGRIGYTINTSALNRLLQGEDPTPQDGDNLETYNWFQPVSAGLSTGAAIADQLSVNGDKIEVAERAMNRSFEELIDLPSMFIIKGMFYESLKKDSGFMDIASVPFTQSLAGFIPSPIRLLAQARDPYQREISGEDRTRQQIMASIPGLREDLPARLDPLGRPIEEKTGLRTLIAPGKGTELRQYPFSDKLRDIERVAGVTTQYPPRSAPKSVTYNKQSYELSQEQKNQYQQIAGNIINQEYTRILEDIEIDQMNDRELQLLIQRLSSVKKRARERAKRDLLIEILDK